MQNDIGSNKKGKKKGGEKEKEKDKDLEKTPDISLRSEKDGTSVSGKNENEWKENDNDLRCYK